MLDNDVSTVFSKHGDSEHPGLRFQLECLHSVFIKDEACLLDCGIQYYSKKVTINFHFIQCSFFKKKNQEWY